MNEKKSKATEIEEEVLKNLKVWEDANFVDWSRGIGSVFESHIKNYLIEETLKACNEQIDNIFSIYREGYFFVGKRCVICPFSIEVFDIMRDELKSEIEKAGNEGN